MRQQTSQSSSIGRWTARLLVAAAALFARPEGAESQTELRTHVDEVFARAQPLSGRVHGYKGTITEFNAVYLVLDTGPTSLMFRPEETELVILDEAHGVEDLEIQERYWSRSRISGVHASRRRLVIRDTRGPRRDSLYVDLPNGTGARLVTGTVMRLKPSYLVIRSDSGELLLTPRVARGLKLDQHADSHEIDDDAYDDTAAARRGWEHIAREYWRADKPLAVRIVQGTPGGSVFGAFEWMSATVASIGAVMLAGSFLVLLGVRLHDARVQTRYDKELERAERRLSIQKQVRESGPLKGLRVLRRQTRPPPRKTSLLRTVIFPASRKVDRRASRMGWNAALRGNGARHRFDQRHPWVALLAILACIALTGFSTYWHLSGTRFILRGGFAPTYTLTFALSALLAGVSFLWLFRLVPEVFLFWAAFRSIRRPRTAPLFARAGSLAVRTRTTVFHLPIENLRHVSADGAQLISFTTHERETLHNLAAPGCIEALDAYDGTRWVAQMYRPHFTKISYSPDGESTITSSI